MMPFPEHFHNFVRRQDPYSPDKFEIPFCDICNFFKWEIIEMAKAPIGNYDLIDWFAGQALASGTSVRGVSIENSEQLAKHTYEIAKAMMKERMEIK